MKKHGLGRLPSPPDARDYRMLDAMHALEKLYVPRPVKLWYSSKVLDQGETPHCVGFAWAGWGISKPVEDPWNNCTGHDIYSRCKVLDGEPKAENGSTVRSGAQVMLDKNRLGTYFFASSVNEALNYLARFGPVVFGTIWTQGMMRPSLVGKIIRPTGSIIGGHAWLAIGVDAYYVTLRNSWSTEWGKAGDARIAIADLKKLFLIQGEACAATEKPLPIRRAA